MSSEAVAGFVALLKEDQTLAERLRTVSDPDAFDALAAELAGERGLQFTAGEFRAVVTEALNRHPGELTEDELQDVAGGVGIAVNAPRVSSIGCQSGSCVLPGIANETCGCTGGFTGRRRQS